MTLADDDLTAPVEALRAAAEARARRRQLDERFAVAGDLVQTRERELEALRETLVGEAADVERLERLSPSRLWATLRGDAEERLAIEKAERDTAAQAVAAAEKRLAQARAEAEPLIREGDELGDVEGRHTAALAALDERVRATGGPAAAELTAIADDLGATAAQRREVREAHAALRTAGAALQEALGELDSAGGWSTYDTFFGGGFLTDLVKHNRIDAATAAFARTNRALEHLAVELADIGAAPVDGVEVSESLAVFDVLFDNIFSDWMVRGRIATARADAGRLGARLGELGRYLAGRDRELAARLATLAARREELLHAVR
ncbi:hypothetical protein N3K63_03690 [Microbacterium sp. W1N]|uniref:hypothetical protein n=1 Tax=Microbacterium festucae TaxID=2977531 RepID=UPI0021C1684D|nr:hypothetical protein [Microbacterium festucae]MCT9819385.1 hypothetical protein [Microbacterium festucae]